MHHHRWDIHHALEHTSLPRPPGRALTAGTSRFDGSSPPPTIETPNMGRGRSPSGGAGFEEDAHHRGPYGCLD